MLTALKTERSDTIEVFFHSSMVSLHSHSRFLVQVAEVFRKPMPGLSLRLGVGGLQFSFSISVLHTTTVAISNIFFVLDKHLGYLQNPGFSTFPHLSLSKRSPAQLENQVPPCNCCFIWTLIVRGFDATSHGRQHKRLRRKRESSRCHLKNTSSFTGMQTQVPQTIPFIPREAGTAPACPANSPSRYLCTLAWPRAALTQLEPPGMNDKR